MGLSVSIDPDLCIGSGDCVRLAPEAFELRDDAGISVPRPAAATEPLERLRKAAMNCPTQAIGILDADGTVIHAANG